MDSEQTRISVGVTRREMDEISQLARRCNTSISALGQLALRHLLLQARSGAIPMLPPLGSAPELTSNERRDRGMLASVDAVWAETTTGLEVSRAELYEAQARVHLTDLDALTAGESSTVPGAAPSKT